MGSEEWRNGGMGERGSWLVASDLIHCFADGAGSGGKLGVGSVADVDKADLVVLAIAAADEGLVAVLEPVRANEERVAERAFDDAAEASAAFALVADRAEARREHPAVHCAEVEFGVQDRTVKSRGGIGAFAEDRDAVDVGVH